MSEQNEKSRSLTEQWEDLVDLAWFVTCSLLRFDKSVMDETGERLEWKLQGGLRRPAGWTQLTRALVPSSVPTWLPMPEVISAHTLQAGARGMRSLFTSKPSEKQRKTAEHVAETATRLIGSLLALKHGSETEERLWLACFVASFGLDQEQTERILALPREVSLEEEAFPEAWQAHKMAASVGRGLWLTAFRDGLDPAQDDLVVAVSQKLGLDAEQIEQSRKWAEQWMAASRQPGMATVDACRFVLGDEPERARDRARLAAELLLPPVHRTEALAAIDHGGPIVLAQRHELSKKQRSVCLAVAWLAALSTDPTATRSVVLAERHDRIAEDLGYEAEGAAVRREVQSWLEGRLLKAIEADG